MTRAKRERETLGSSLTVCHSAHGHSAQICWEIISLGAQKSSTPPSHSSLSTSWNEGCSFCHRLSGKNERGKENDFLRLCNVLLRPDGNTEVLKNFLLCTLSSFSNHLVSAPLSLSLPVTSSPPSSLPPQTTISACSPVLQSSCVVTSWQNKELH